jgi:hypothetical protein
MSAKKLLAHIRRTVREYGTPKKYEEVSYTMGYLGESQNRAVDKVHRWREFEENGIYYSADSKGASILFDYGTGVTFSNRTDQIEVVVWDKGQIVYREYITRKVKR